MKKIEKLRSLPIVAILLVGLLVRLYKIDNPVADWHSWRQADTASVTRTFIDKGIDLLHPKYHDISTTQTGLFNPEGYRMVEFPIFNFVHGLLYKAFPFFSFEVWGRLVSVISSLISATTLFYIGKRYLGYMGGILSSFFFLFLPFNIYFSRVILPEPMAVMFGLLSLFLFNKYIETEKNLLVYASGLAFSLALLVKPYIIFYGIPLIYLASQKYGFKNIFRKRQLILALGIALIPLLFWRIWISQYPEGIAHFKWVFNGDRIRFRPSFWMWIFGERLSRLILGGTGMIPFAFGVLYYKKNRAFINMFLLGCLLYVFVIATANVRHDYYQTIIVPAISLALAGGSLVIWEAKQMNKIFARTLLVMSVVIAMISGWVQIREFYKINHPEIIEAGSAVNKLVPKDALVVAPYNGDAAFLYQTKRWGWPVVDRPINEIIENGADYYVSVNYDDQTNEFTRRFSTVIKTSNYIILDLNRSL